MEEDARRATHGRRRKEGDPRKKTGRLLAHKEADAPANHEYPDPRSYTSANYGGRRPRRR